MSSLPFVWAVSEHPFTDTGSTRRSLSSDALTTTLRHGGTHNAHSLEPVVVLLPRLWSEVAFPSSVPSRHRRGWFLSASTAVVELCSDAREDSRADADASVPAELALAVETALLSRCHDKVPPPPLSPGHQTQQHPTSLHQACFHTPA